MKLVSWNVNGLRACMQKGFIDYFKATNADIFCIQETKLQENQKEIEGLNLSGYYAFWNFAEKKGYSGTAIFTKYKPLSVTYKVGIPNHDKEGRIITLEYERFFLVNTYTPNSQRGLTRLDYRMEWEDNFRNYLLKLDSLKPVILCGDLNVAHQEIDIKNPAANKRNAGFTDEERRKMTFLLNSGFIDTFRYFYPDKKDAYTWWSYMHNAREKNIGWRVDYFIVSEKLKDYLIDSQIHSEVMGSDHCPVVLIVKDELTK